MAFGPTEREAVIDTSVIISTYNRVDQLRACLESLVRQTYPTDKFEVIVVIDGSNDGTRELAAGYNPPYKFRFLEQPNSGQSVALNRGATLAVGKILIFIDDDLIADSSLVAEHTTLQKNHDNTVGIGQLTLDVSKGADWFTQSYSHAWNDHYNKLNNGVRLVGWDDCYGGNTSVHYATYLKVGGNDESLWRAKDMDLAYRLHQHGCRFLYLENARAVIKEQKRFKALCADFEKTGYQFYQLYCRYPATLPRLIGNFRESRLSFVILWRFLLSLRISPRLIEPFLRVLAKHIEPSTCFFFLQRYCLWKGVRNAADSRDWKRLTFGTPILMYHAFGGPNEAAKRYVIPIRRFAIQMACLKLLGYRVVSLEDYLRHRAEYSLPPARSVVITIDDGYADNWTLAYPVLTCHGFSATIFVVSKQVGSRYHIEKESDLNGRPMLSWSQINTMVKNGIQIGAHTRSHPDLTKIALPHAQQEISGAKTDLEQALGIPIRLFSYPFGANDTNIQIIVQESGFLGSCSVKSGLNTPMTSVHLLRRVEIRGTDSLIAFALAVRFGERAEVLRGRVRLFIAQLLQFTTPRKFATLARHKRSIPREGESFTKLKEEKTLETRL